MRVLTIEETTAVGGADGFVSVAAAGVIFGIAVMTLGGAGIAIAAVGLIGAAINQGIEVASKQ